MPRKSPKSPIGSGANQANYAPGGVYAVTQNSSYDSNQNYLTDVGAFSGSGSFYGTFCRSRARRNAKAAGRQAPRSTASGAGAGCSNAGMPAAAKPRRGRAWGHSFGHSSGKSGEAGASASSAARTARAPAARPRGRRTCESQRRPVASPNEPRRPSPRSSAGSARYTMTATSLELRRDGKHGANGSRPGVIRTHDQGIMSGERSPSHLVVTPR